MSLLAGIIIAVACLIAVAGGATVIVAVAARKAGPFLCRLCEGLDPQAPCLCEHGCGMANCGAYR
jgi:hypothetical protein